MVSNRKVTGTAKSIPIGILIGAVVCLAVTLLGAAVVAYLISRESIAQESVGAGSMIVLILASALGCLVAAKLTRRRRLLICGSTAAAFYPILLAMTAMLFGGEYTGMGITALCVMGGAAIVVLLGLVGNGQGKIKHKIPAYR